MFFLISYATRKLFKRVSIIFLIKKKGVGGKKNKILGLIVSQSRQMKPGEKHAIFFSYFVIICHTKAFHRCREM